jgi:hypothetical protein
VKALLEVVEDALDRLAAGAHPADVGVVEDVGGEADEPALVRERRLDHEEVREVPRAEERAVEQHDVPGPELVAGERLDRVLRGERHRAHVAGAVGALGHHPPRGVEEADREILALARLLRVRGPVNGGADLHRNRLERAPDDAEGDGIEARHRASVMLTRRFAHGSTSAAVPGGSTVVDSASSTTAGPSMCAPTGRRARS